MILSPGFGADKIRLTALPESILFFAAANGFADRLGGFDRHRLLVRRVEIKVDPAERTGVFVLAQNDRDLAIQGDAVAQMRPTAFIRFDRLLQQTKKRGMKFIRSFVQANDVLVVNLHRFGDLMSEQFGSHVFTIKDALEKGRQKLARLKSGSASGLRNGSDAGRSVEQRVFPD